MSGCVGLYVEKEIPKLISCIRFTFNVVHSGVHPSHDNSNAAHNSDKSRFKPRALQLICEKLGFQDRKTFLEPGALDLLWYELDTLFFFFERLNWTLSLHWCAACTGTFARKERKMEA